MDKVDELIARLASEGELDSAGGFTLDPKVALDKLREFTLRDPTRFVLSWVRAATLLGATRVDIEIDADDVWFRFDGDTLTAAEFEALWSSVVGGSGSAKLRACRELALGINGAFIWSAKAVSVHSGELQVDVARDFSMTPAASVAGSTAASGLNTIHAKRPLGWDLVRRRVLDKRGELPEELLLASACAHGRVPLYLEGKLLNPEVPEPADAWLTIPIDDDHRRGRLTLRPGQRSQLRVLVAGVEVRVLELPFGQGVVDALIDDPLLPLDLSGEKLVEGERWQALLDCVSQARWTAWFMLARNPAAPGRAHLIEDMLASDDASWLDVPGAMDFADRIELPRAVTNRYAGYVSLTQVTEDDLEIAEPWPCPPPPPLTLGHLVRSARRRGVLFTSPAPRDDLPYSPELPVLLYGRPLGLAALGRVTLDRPATIERYLAERAGLQPLAGERPLPESWLELRHHSAALKLRVAWARGAHRCRGSLTLGCDGAALRQFTLPSRWGPLWIEVEFGHAAELARPIEDNLAAALAVLAMLERHHDLLGALDGEQLSAFEREVVLTYLREGFGHWSARRLHELGRLSARVREGALASWQGGWGVPPDWVRPPPSERAGCDHALMDLAWLEHGGRWLSLRDIQRQLAIHSALVWVERTDSSPELPPEVWRLDATERAIISDVFFGALERFDHHAWARRVLGRAAVPAKLDGACESVVITGAANERGNLRGSLRGILGLPDSALPGAWANAPGRNARLRVLASGHDLGWMDVPLPVGPFYGVIEIPSARAVTHADRIVKDDAWVAAAALVEAAALELARARLEDWSAGRRRASERARVRDWLIDLESAGGLDRGGHWRAFAAAMRSWQASLPADHPLRVELEIARNPKS